MVLGREEFDKYRHYHARLPNVVESSLSSPGCWLMPASSTDILPLPCNISTHSLFHFQTTVYKKSPIAHGSKYENLLLQQNYGHHSQAIIISCICGIRIPSVTLSHMSQRWHQKWHLAISRAPQVSLHTWAYLYLHKSD